MTLAKHGLDVTIAGAGRKIDARGRIEAIGLAQKAGIQRLIVDGDSVLAGAIPVVTLSGVDVALPDATFLQAVPEAEAILRQDGR